MTLGEVTKDSASVVMMADVGDYITKYMTAGCKFPYGPLGMEWYTNYPAWSYTPGLHHNGGSNMGFVDGHAKWVAGPRGYIVKQTYNGITWNAKSHADGW
jgi:prepilin-type processing-associated H-X9-DG protein